MSPERTHLVIAPVAVLFAGCTAEPESPIDPLAWQEQPPVFTQDPAIESRIDDLLARMTLEEKVGQIIQADIGSITPDEVREYNLGSILNGGSSAPGDDNRAPPQAWLDLADEFWDASTDTGDGGVGIPIMWGTDAVHGNNKLVGATLFPHNIGLGMMNDPDLMYDIGRVTAMEILPSGLDWTFAPTIAVARDDRWGRTYESFSEDPAIVAAYAPKIIAGIQGGIGTDDFLDEDHVIATAKHFAGDGGTTDGRDQGDTAISLESFRDLHTAAYSPAVAAGAQTVMASFNSYHGRKMHGSREMLTNVLVGRLGFDGLVVGDWNGHGQVRGCSNTSCAAAINAGLDMFMAPESWRGLYSSTLAQARSGEIGAERLDEAVARILRVKIRAGIFQAGRPSTRRHAGNFELLGAPAHRAIARKAVRRSLVLLKNEDGTLPIAPSANVLVAGDGAHDIGKQSGGWTLNWQGTDNLREHFPNGTSIYEGIAEVIEAGGGTATLSTDGDYEDKPDIAIVVFGEDPYAEGVGDRPHVDYVPTDGLDLLRRYRDEGIRTVSVFLSGRPMFVNPEMNQSDAFVAAWLPGTEGGGVADVLVADAAGAPRFDFTGRLSFSWPRDAMQTAVNVGDEDYDPLFPYGFGLSYAEAGELQALPEDSGLSDDLARFELDLMRYGDPVAPRSLILWEDDSIGRVSNSRGATESVAVSPIDRDVQEDAIEVTWSGKATLSFDGPGIDLSSKTRGDLAFEIVYEVGDVAAAEVLAGGGNEPEDYATIDITDGIASRSGTGWTTSYLRLSCFERYGAPMENLTKPLFLTADGPLQLRLQSVRVVGNPGDADCSLSTE